MAEHARSRAWRIVLKGLPAIFFLAAVYFWFCYMAQGIAYGDLFGIRGRESDLAIMASRASAFLGLALFFEAFAIAMIAWFFADDVRPIWQRLCLSVVVAFALDFFTYAVIRP